MQPSDNFPVAQGVCTNGSISLPGISAEFLSQAGVHRIDAENAFKIVGIREAGILFPYRTMHGEPVEDGDAPFARLRMDTPRGDRKYHQRKGSEAHAYLPPTIYGEEGCLENPIIIVEGEKKCLALAEAGQTAIGIGGFYNFRDQAKGLVPELSELLGCVRGPFIVFLGDKDVVFNYQFSHAAHQFAQMVSGASVAALCVPLNAPGKGVDDCRAVLGDKFSSWFVGQYGNCVQITDSSTPGTIALELLRNQIQLLRAMDGAERDMARKGIAKLAAGLGAYPMEQAETMDIAVQNLSLGRQIFKRMVRDAKNSMLINEVAAEIGGDISRVVNLGQQTGKWTAEALKAIGPSTYYFGGNLCELDEGQFHAHTPATLAPRIDNEACCRFVRGQSGGEMSQTQLGERDAKLILGALRPNRSLLRPVRTLSHVPVLVWSGEQADMVVGYSPEHEILAGTGEMELPDPETAASELNWLLHDFDFPTPGDAGRATAYLLTTALINGGFLASDRAPFFMFQKNLMGTGAGTFVQTVAAVYGEQPHPICPENPKAAGEDISRLLLQGVSHFYLDNIRGKLLTQLGPLESLLTEPRFICRAPYLHGEVNVEKCVIACTSNGAVLSPDLADRTVKIALRKRPDGYAFHAWPEGGLIDHARAQSLRYLGCIYSLIKGWVEAGRQDGAHLTGFRYRKWERACTWILENYFGGLLLLDAEHQADQRRMADPDHDMLRSIFRHAVEANITDPVTATDLARIAIDRDLMDADEKGAALKLGRSLTRLCPKANSSAFVSEYSVMRTDIRSQDTNYEALKRYTIREGERISPPDSNVVLMMCNGEPSTLNTIPGVGTIRP